MTLLLPQARRLATELEALDVCPGCLHGFAAQLRDARPGAVDGLRASCPKFWDACAAVVANTSPNATSINALTTATARCPLHSADNDLHILIDAACACLHVGLQRAGGQPAPLDDDALWPARIEGMVPDGARALVGWCMLLDDRPFPMLLLAEALSAAPTYIFPALLREKDGMADALVRRSRAGVRSLGPALAVICSVRDATGADVDALLQLTLGHEARLFAAAMHALNLPTVPPPIQSILATFAASLFPRLELAESALDPRVRARVEDPGKLSLAGILYRLFLSLTLRRRVCTACGCNNASGTTNTSFAMCSRCAITPYCSTACEHDDWDALGGGIPHKVVCPLIARILAIASLSQSREDFERAVLDAPQCQWSSEERHALAYFATAHGNLPTELFPRARYLHVQYSAAIGIPIHEYEELEHDPEIAAAMDVMNRQERWAAGI